MEGDGEFRAFARSRVGAESVDVAIQAPEAAPWQIHKAMIADSMAIARALMLDLPWWRSSMKWRAAAPVSTIKRATNQFHEWA